MSSVRYSDVMLPQQPQNYAIEIRRKNYLQILTEADNQGAFLEIGPGNGEMLSVAKDVGFSWLEIVDTDLGVVKRIQEWHPEVKTNHIEPDFPLPDILGLEKYSCIVACHVFEHIPQGQRISALGDYLKMLRPGGVLILELPNPLCPLGGWANYLADPTHQMPTSSTGLRKLLLLVGFSDIIVGSVNPVISIRSMLGVFRWGLAVSIGAIANLLGRTSDIRSPNYFVVARRT